jgi:glycosyltransferase involved in cell wall biosynthesis
VSKIKILFLQSQEKIYADSVIHGLLMRFLERERFEVHLACNPAALKANSPAMQSLASVPDLRVRSTNFGPSVYAVPTAKAILRTIAGAPQVVFNMTGLARYIWANRIDIIHCTEKPRDAFYGFLLARATGARCVIHLHVKVENWISPLTRWVMKRADAIVGVSSFVAQSNIAMGYSASRTCYIHNGIDISDWDASADGGYVRQEFNTGADTVLLAAIGRLVYYKGQMELLEAVRKVHQSYPEVRLLIVGEGDELPGSFTQRLKAMVETTELRDFVAFTGHRRDVREILAASDIFTFPSFEEPFGMVYLEAMLMKKPVVALDNGGAREIVEHGKTGLLSAPKDIDQLAANIVTLIRDRNLRTRMGEDGRRRVEERFSAERMAREFGELYQKILNR